MNRQDYFADKRINASTLKMFAGRDFEPLIALHKMRNGLKESQAMSLGTGVHEIMEVGILNAKFEAITSAYKTTGPREAAIEKAKNMANSIFNKAPEYILDACINGQKETAFFNGDFKALLDVHHDGVGIDWKTTSAESRSEFERDFFKYHYDIQDYQYRFVANLNRMIFVVVSTAEPHPVWIYETTSSCQTYGKQQWQEAYDRYLQYKDKDLSTFTAETIDMMEPAWAFNEDILA